MRNRSIGKFWQVQAKIQNQKPYRHLSLISQIKTKREP